MKRKNIIIIFWIIWIVSMIGVAFGVYYYINNKRIRLRSEIRKNVESIFEGQASGSMSAPNNAGFFDVAYSGSPIVTIRKSPSLLNRLKTDFPFIFQVSTKRKLMTGNKVMVTWHHCMN